MRARAVAGLRQIGICFTASDTVTTSDRIVSRQKYERDETGAKSGTSVKLRTAMGRLR
jgi:hypothetical protein